MNHTDQQIKKLFRAAKRFNAGERPTDDHAPYGFSTRVAAKAFASSPQPLQEWAWEKPALGGAICICILCLSVLWFVRSDLAVFSDEFVEVRAVDATYLNYEIL